MPSIQKYNFETFNIDPKMLLYYTFIDPALPYVPFKWHEEYEIIFCRQGSVEIIFTNGKIDLKKNDLYIIDSQTPHATKCSLDCILSLIAIPPSSFRQELPDYNSLYFDLHMRSSDPTLLTEQENLKKYILEYDSLSKEKSNGYQLLLNSIALKIFYELYTFFRIAQPDEILRISSQEQEHFVQMINYVNLNYMNPISIQKASSICHLQPQYFCRFFKKNMGKTFQVFLNEVRLNHALEELLQSSKKINEIASHNGFPNSSSFRKLFLEHYGCLPREFRMTHKS